VRTPPARCVATGSARLRRALRLSGLSECTFIHTNRSTGSARRRRALRLSGLPECTFIRTDHHPAQHWERAPPARYGAAVFVRMHLHSHRSPPGVALGARTSGALCVCRVCQNAPAFAPIITPRSTGSARLRRTLCLSGLPECTCIRTDHHTAQHWERTPPAHFASVGFARMHLHSHRSPPSAALGARAPGALCVCRVCQNAPAFAPIITPYKPSLRWRKV
jgi:hypothetical protein